MTEQVEATASARAAVFFELMANWFHGAVLHRLRDRTLGLIAAVSFALLTAIAVTRGDIDVGPTGVLFVQGVPRVAFAYVAGVLVWRRFGNRPPVVLPPAVLVLAMPVLFVLFDGWIFDLAFVGLVCPLLLLAGIRWNAPRGAAFLGAISYPLYAVQLPVLDVARLLGFSWPMGVAIALALAIFIASWPAKKPARLPLSFRPRLRA